MASTAKPTGKTTNKPRLGDDLPRLGDDLPAARRAEPLNVIVARSHIVGGKIRLELPSPGALRAHRGQKVQIKHVYRLEEHSADKEEYRFLLRSSLGGKEHAPAMARHGDVYAMPEDIGGYLVHEFTATGSGIQVLAFEVGAEYVVGDWKDTIVKSHEQKQAKGEIRITVA